MAEVDFVRLSFDNTEHPPNGRRKLKFRHKDLRDVVNTTKQSISDLFGDPFGGWPYLLVYGMRAYDINVTLDQASELIELWVKSRPTEKTPLDSLGKQLLAALNASGLVKIRADLADQADDPTGNAQPEAVSTLTEA